MDKAKWYEQIVDEKNKTLHRTGSSALTDIEREGQKEKKSKSA